MDATSVLDGVRLLPVVVVDDPDNAERLAHCLLDAGIGAMEITLRTPAALAAMQRVARSCPQMLVGAGSVLRPEQFTQVADAGAVFAVSPGATPELAAAARMPWVPGAATASEVLALLAQGYSLQKFFPAQRAGGVAMLRDFAGPMPDVRFCPTGGVSAENARDYLALANVACVGGSWFVPPSAVNASDMAEVGRLATAAVALLN